MTAMKSSTEQTAGPPFIDGEAEPTWAIAELFPHQGQWSEEEYLALPTNHLVEYSHGILDVVPMPSELHQDIVLFLAELLSAFVRRTKLGKVAIAPLPMRLWTGKYREPDILFMLHDNKERRRKTYWIGADLVMEVVSPDDPRRDLETKRREYAQAGISEYWIVDPRVNRVTVLTLNDMRYSIHGEFGAGQQADSVLLDGFTVDVDELFAAAE
ncbi:MAG: restriction endonuclease [Chloroflexota bacterium]|jgi:Uma2 family endonuclease|nr:MAG: restriction endonuclease [Chloroflexota bacterium]